MAGRGGWGAIADYMGGLGNSNALVQYLQMLPKAAQTAASGAWGPLAQGYEAIDAVDQQQRAAHPTYAKVSDALGLLTSAGPSVGMIRAYHGSPHMFDQFSLSKIGTGEGGQAFGHGLYFAENPSVAESYRRSLARPEVVTEAERYRPTLTVADRHEPKAIAYSYLTAAKDAQSAEPFSYAKDMIARLEGDKPASRKAQDVLMQWKREGAAVENGGAMYGVNIEHPPEKLAAGAPPLSLDDLLHFDKPVSEQSQSVRDALEKAFRDRGFPLASGTNTPSVMLDPRMTGEQAHAYLASSLQGNANNAAGQAAAAEKLRSIGIPGIAYLDQGSRGGEGATHNFVIFDDAYPTVTDINGKPVIR